MARTIYLEYDEDLISALQKIQKAGEDEVVLVMPKGARLLRNLTGLRLLKQQGQRLGKKLSVATADEQGKLLLARAELPIAQNVALPPTKVSAPVAPGRRRMGDIVIRPPKPPAPTPFSVSTPPSEAKSEQELSVLFGPEIESKPITIPEPVKIPRISVKYTLVPSLVFLAVFAVVVFYVLPHAVITVAARTEAVTRDLELLVDSSAGVPDVQNLTIPGQKISEEANLSKTYPTTGTKNVGEKASGFVTLYNFSKNSLILKSSTTRLEAGGKTYFFLHDVGSIRPTARIGPELEIDPSSLIDPVPIAAVLPGEASNLPAGTRFEIFNEVFGHQPEVLYAVNQNPIAGGTNKEVKVLAEADIDAAHQDLASVIVEKMRQELKNKLTAGSVMADNAFRLEILEETGAPPVGTEIEQFGLSQKVRVAALVYNQEDVRALIEERIVRLLPENKFLLPESEQKLTAQFVSLDLNAGSGTLRAHFESKVKYHINADFLGKSLPGKTAIQVKEILLARPEVEDVKVELSPFWVKKVPRFASKIEFRIED